MTDDAREQLRRRDVRVGSATDALAPISVAERSLGAGAAQWLGLAAVGLAAVAADQLTKRIVNGRLGLGDAVHVIGPFSIVGPHVTIGPGTKLLNNVTVVNRVTLGAHNVISAVPKWLRT